MSADGRSTYGVLLQSGATRALSERLPEAIAFAAWAFIQGQLRVNPRRHGHPLRAPHAGKWSASRGAYRIIYRIDDVAGIVRILDIASHRDVYRAR